jgi:hypothetical protein
MRRHRDCHGNGWSVFGIIIIIMMRLGPSAEFRLGESASDSPENEVRPGPGLASGTDSNPNRSESLPVIGYFLQA